MKARTGAMEARPEAMQARPEAMQARPGTMDACPEAMEAAPCSLTYDLKRFFKQQGKVFQKRIETKFKYPYLELKIKKSLKMS